jgi:sec-independent protein translocase protein TatB
MFDIGWGELVVIGVIALIVIGPKELPTVLRTLGQYMAKVKRMAADFQGQFQDAMREAEIADLKKQADELTSSVSDMSNFDPMEDTKREVEQAFETPEHTEPAMASSDAGPTAGTKALPPVDVPPPEHAAPQADDDLVRLEPPPKPAGGTA